MKPEVSIARCSDYEEETVRAALEKCLEPIGGLSRYVKSGDHVLIKLNLLSAKEPEAAVTTHPALVRAVVRKVQEMGAVPIVGDSPGGRGTSSVSYQSLLKKTGIQAVVDETGCESVWFDEACEEIFSERAKKYRKFTVAKAVRDADVVIGLPKLKTHQFATFSGAVKLLYGYLPGMTKAEYHLHTADNIDNFAALLLDLYATLPPALFIMDAVVGMEGNGPSSGMPRHIGLLMASPDGPALDFVASSIVGFDPLSIPTVRQAWKQGVGPKTLEEIHIAGEDPLLVRLSDFKKPDAHPVGRVPPELIHVAQWFLAVKPVIESRACTRCGTCAVNCPPAAIHWSEGKVPTIDYRSCIRCFCCQELCPSNAVRVKKPLIPLFGR